MYVCISPPRQVDQFWWNFAQRLLTSAFYRNSTIKFICTFDSSILHQMKLNASIHSCSGISDKNSVSVQTHFWKTLFMWDIYLIAISTSLSGFFFKTCHLHYPECNSLTLVVWILLCCTHRHTVCGCYKATKRSDLQFSPPADAYSNDIHKASCGASFYTTYF